MRGPNIVLFKWGGKVENGKSGILYSFIECAALLLNHVSYTGEISIVMDTRSYITHAYYLCNDTFNSISLKHVNFVKKIKKIQ